MSDLKKLFDHSSNYFVGQILLLAAGFISFPIYTRVLSVGEYGLLGLITATLTLSVAFSKLGLQHSSVRFYSEFDSHRRTPSISHFYSTLFLGVIALGGLASLFFFLGLELIADAIIDQNLRKLLGLVSILILIYSALDTFGQFFRAEQKPKAYMLLNVVSRYGSILVGILFYFYFGRILYGLFMGIITWQAILFFVLCYLLLRTRNIHFGYFSLTFLKEALKYGFPLIAVELSHLILHFGDRYLIQYYLGPVSLGIYAAGYSMATYTAQLITLPIRDAVLPIYMDIWEKEGEDATKHFLGKGLRYYSLIAIPVIFGFSIVASDLIVLLASNKYAQSSIVVPYVLTGSIFYGTWSFFSAGLFIQKKTFTITVLMAASCAVNVVLNIILIPVFDIVGAALATLMAYTFYISMLIILSFRRLKFQIDYLHILLYLALSLVMCIVITNISIANPWISLCSRMISGVLFYSFLVLLFDKQIRYEFLEFVRSYLVPRITAIRIKPPI